MMSQNPIQDAQEGARFSGHRPQAYNTPAEDVNRFSNGSANDVTAILDALRHKRSPYPGNEYWIDSGWDAAWRLAQVVERLEARQVEQEQRIAELERRLDEQEGGK